MHWSRTPRTWCVLPLLVAASTAGAQVHLEPHADAFWLSGGLLVTASARADHWVHSIAERAKSDRLDRIATFLEPVGRPPFLVPALAVTYSVARGMGERRFADATLRTAVSYGASDAIGYFLKWAVGRHRPTGSASSSRFHPGTFDPQWHSFPSGHAFQAFAIAAAVSDESGNPWVGAAAYSLAGLTGLERLYKQAHWASDVVGGAVIAIATSLSTDRWIRRNGLGSLIRPRVPGDP